MSEKLKTAEQLPKAEHLELPARKAEKPASSETAKALSPDKARETVAETTRSDTRPNPLEGLEKAENASQVASPASINRDLKQITLRRELQQIRRRLPAPARALSHWIHQPAVRVASEAAGRTVSRPSGLLGGGLVALVGTTTYIYLAKHYGFTYNYGVFLALFVCGFALGLLIEFVVWAAFSPKRRARD